MIKMIKSCVGILLVAGISVQAATVWDDTFALATAMWDDDFSGTPNANATPFVTGAASITQAGGQLILNTGETGDGAQAAVSMLVDETGAISMFNGANLYNFYDHKVSVRFDIADITGTPNGADNRNSFNFSIGDDAEGNFYPPVMDNGLGISLEHLDIGGGAFWRLVISTSVGGTFTPFSFPEFNGLPSALSFSIDGTSLIIDVEGTTFTSGGTTASFPVPDISANISGYSLAFSASNSGTPLTQTVVTLDAFKATVGGGINENLTVSENAGVVSQAGGQLVLDTGLAAGTAEAAVNTLTDETGAITTFDGANLYNFYNHQVSARFDIASITGTPNGANNRNWFYFSIGDDGTGHFSQQLMDNGLGFVLEKLNTGSDRWRIVLSERVGGADTFPLIGDLSGLPTALIYTLSGTNITVEAEGATFTDASWLISNGDTTVTGAASDLSASISGYSLAFGAYNLGTVTDKTVVTLDAFSVVVSAKSFTTWSDIWGVDIGSETNDYDGDLLDNLGEYGLGGDPTDSADRGLVPTFANEGGTMVYVYAQRTDDDNLSYHLETNDNLTLGGNWADSGYTELGTDVTGGLFDFVTNTIPTTADETFIRLRIQNN